MSSQQLEMARSAFEVYQHLRNVRRGAEKTLGTDVRFKDFETKIEREAIELILEILDFPPCTEGQFDRYHWIHNVWEFENRRTVPVELFLKQLRAEGKKWRTRLEKDNQRIFSSDWNNEHPRKKKSK